MVTGVITGSFGAGKLCAVATGGVYCQGSGVDLAPVPGTSGAVDMDIGADFFCAVKNDGKIICWGENARGQLGNGMTTPSTTPVEVMGITGAGEVSAGSAHACARTGAGEIFCWGDNSYGQLGDPTFTGSFSTLPRRASLLAPAICPAP